MRPLSNKNLNKIVHHLCQDFFPKISNIPRASFGVIEEEEGKTDGEYESSENRIIIDRSLACHPDLTILVVMHELAHAELCVGDTVYTGHDPLFDHGQRFGAIIVRLFEAGAYDNLL